MDEKNYILIISDDEVFSANLAEKLVFLRKNDAVSIVNYSDAFNFFTSNTLAVVLVHENISQAETFDLISKLKNETNATIIFLPRSYDSDTILNAYDYGADDFILADAENFEFVLRIVHNINNNSIKHKFLKNKKLLEQTSVIDELTGFYNYNYAKQVIENAIDFDLINTAVLLIISPRENSVANFSIEKMARALKLSTRNDDYITLGKGAKFYLFLPKTSENVVISVIEKIKTNYGNDVSFAFGISGMENKNFDEMEHDAIQALSEAMSSEQEYVIANDKNETLDEWLDTDSFEPKNYKLFRQIFNRKLEKVIIPVFFRLQKAYEDKLSDTDIEQYTNENQCVFSLTNKKQTSVLRIIYPGFAKIVINTTHEGLDSPEDKEMHIPLTKISQKELVKIVEDFIKDFESTLV